ncbi:MAG: aminotransferase class I/II-fold pyridoxal phosphate-dependent enzyme [Calditrichae bacterium]|nr:aminotransferase class I/II-fold pyridoxal phosphate-dependent enzyme [Calditrichia bacterium]
MKPVSEHNCHIDPTDIEICLGHDEPLYEQNGTMMPPVYQTSLFAKKTFAELVNAFPAEHQNYIYSRGQNPTVDALEKKLAALEHGEACKCSASGMAAVSSLFYGLLKRGDHILFVNNIYGPTLQLANHLRRFGIEHNVCLSRDTESIERDIRPETRLIYFESPATMTFRMLDIRQLVELAKSRNILTAIDNTWATPLFMKPLAMGVDISLHSLTKYVGGHSDVVAGALITNAELHREIFANGYMLNGGAMAPWNGWLLIRGLRTLPNRMLQHHRDGLQIARFLSDHPAVARVNHPAFVTEDCDLLPQLSGFSSLFSIELKTEKFADICSFIDNLRLFRTGVSWGGVESLVISPSNGSNADVLRQKGISPGLVRFSVGLEGVEALIADLDQALSKISV